MKSVITFIFLTSILANGQPFAPMLETQMSSGQTNAASLPEPVLRYPMTDGAGTVLTDAIGANNGTLFSSAAWVARGTGISTPAASAPFSISCEGNPGGTQYVKSGAVVSALGSAQHASLCGWVYTAEGSDSFGFGQLNENGSRFGVELSGGNMYCVVESGGGNFPNISYAFTGWHFVSLTFDGTQPAASRLVVYVDGASQTITPGGAGTPSALDTAASQQDFYIGFAGGDSVYLAGGYCDLQEYSITLTSTQVTLIYNAGPQ